MLRNLVWCVTGSMGVLLYQVWVYGALCNDFGLAAKYVDVIAFGKAIEMVTVAVCVHVCARALAIVV
eukprot:364560-Chlamydomonas_euryale.AAC.4